MTTTTRLPPAPPPAAAGVAAAGVAAGADPDAPTIPAEAPEPLAPPGSAPTATTTLWQARRLVVLLVTLGFVVLCAAPYAVARARTPPGTTFSGTLVNHFDQDYYRAAQRSAAEDLGRRNRFTTEVGAPGPIAPLYPLLGEVQQRTGLPALLVYHLPRVLGTVALPLVLAWLFSLCFPGRPDRALAAVVLTLFGAGLATVLPQVHLAARAADKLPEANAQLSLTLFPHFALAWLGIAAAFGTLLMALARRPWRRVAATGAAAGLLLGLSHPFLLLPVMLTGAELGLGAIWAAARRRAGWGEVGRLALAGGAMVAVAAPFVVRLAAEQARFEALQGARFPVAASDQWWTWLAGYGIVAPLAVLGLLRLARRRQPLDRAMAVMVLWLLSQAVLLYSPVTVFQRRYAEGLAIPLAAMAAVGLAWACQRVGARESVGVLAVAAVVVIGSLAVVERAAVGGRYVDGAHSRLWRAVGPGDVVLAGKTLSWMVPAFSPATAYVGRPVETLHAADKRGQRAAYGADPASPAGLDFLRRTGVTVVAVDGHDASFRPAVGDGQGTCLRLFLEAGGLTAYRVVPACLDADLGPGR